MTKSDLHTGMMVELRNGTKMIVMFDPDDDKKEGGWFLSVTGPGSRTTNCYNNDFVYMPMGNATSSDNDITKIYSCDMWGYFKLFYGFNEIDWTLIWDRSTEYKTLAEIKEALGIENLTIVDEGGKVLLK